MTLLELITLLRKHLKIVVVLPVVCAIAMALASVIVMRNTYTATGDMYVLAGTADGSGSALSSELSASQMLSNDVATLLTSSRVEDDAARQVGLEDLKDFDISVSSETTTRLISLSVTGADPQQTADVANALMGSVSAVAQEVMSVESVNVVDEAEVPTAPSGPNRMLYIAVAVMAGLFAAVAIVVLIDILDTRVRGEHDVEQLLGVPVIGRIPIMKGGM